MQHIRFMPTHKTPHTETHPSLHRLFRVALPIVFALLLLSIPLYLWTLDQGVAQAETNVGAEIELFTANLSGANEGTPNTSIATGRAYMTIISDTLYYRIFVADIDGIGMAHIHEGQPGVNGPVIHDIYTGTGTFDPQHPVSGTITLSPEEKTKLQAGDYYINVHTTTFGGGEIRGQLIKEELETAYNALLLGSNQSPPIDTPASGVANFTLTPTDTYTLTFEIGVANIMSITAAHIHRGGVGQNGTVVHDFYNGVDPFDPSNPLSGTVNLDARDILDLESGFFYANVHTDAHASGEIRGQIGGAHLFDANLAAANEVANVESIATGRAVLALSRDATELTYRVFVDDIEDISMAHIHRNPVGVNGPVIHDLYTGTVAFDPANSISGTLTLTRGEVIDLITGNYYVNVHTGNYPSGEIRGQVEAFTPPAHLNATLTGAGEVPAVDTEAVGIARLRFDTQSNVLHHSVVITNVVNVNAAHIHKAPSDANGPVVFEIFNDSGGDTFDFDNPVGGGNELEAADLVDLFTGFYYVNVHTDAHTSGEMRGQIGGAQIYQANLSGAEEVQPVITEGSGRAVLALSDDTTALAYRVFVNRLMNVTDAHIHRAPFGVNGGVVFDLFQPGIFDPQHPVSGTLALDAYQVLDLLGGNYYINVHTTVHGGGEIRGQVQPYDPRHHLHAALTGGEETSTTAATAQVHGANANASNGTDSSGAIDTDAVGITRLTLDTNLNMVRFSVAVTDIQDILATHIHFGPSGVAGPIRHFLYEGGGPFGPGEPIADALPFDAASWVDLLTGYHYVNVHTSAHASGEIRGQLGGASLYQAVLSGDQEAPPVVTDGTGHAVLALSADATQLVYRVSAEDIGTITDAHIHKAPPGVDGGVIFPLYTGGATPPSQPISGTLAITTGQIFDLLQGNYYVNIHTSVEAGGEIRGQVGPYTPTTQLGALLTPQQEVMVSQVTPSGRGFFDLDAEMGVLNYTVIVTGTPDIIAAHIHKAPAGVNGPIVFLLFEVPGTFDATQPIGGALELDGQELVDLLTQFYYVNVHTADDADGKIRGQIVIPLRLNLPRVSQNPNE